MCERCGGQLTAIPAIDISQLARLDELTGAPAAGAAPPATARDPFAPPSAGAPAQDVFAPPPGTFGPAAEGAAQDEQELAVERSTRAIRIANQFRNAAPPAASPAKATPLAATPPSSSSRPAPAGIAAAGVQVRGIAIVIAVVLVLAIILLVAIMRQRA